MTEYQPMQRLLSEIDVTSHRELSDFTLQTLSVKSLMEAMLSRRPR